MKKLLKGLCLALALVLLVCGCGYGGIETYADALDGRSQMTAKPLTLGKARTVKFSKDQSGTYFSVITSEVGRLQVTLNGKDTGCGAQVDIFRSSSEWISWRQSKEIAYNKSKKKLSGKMTSEYILPKGVYIVKVTPTKALKKSKKYTIKASVVGGGYADIEPNSPEDHAQPMDISSQGGAKTYKMLLSNMGTMGESDIMDCFVFKLKDTKQFQIKFAMKEPLESMSLLVCRKNPEETSIVKRFDIKGTRFQTNIKLAKGTYYLKVWYYGDSMTQIPYTISGCAQQRVTSVKLNKSQLTLWVNQKYGAVSAKLKPTVNPSNATNKKLAWKSSDPKVATVSAEGKVTAKATGKTTITATAQDGSKKSASCVVTVKAPTPKISGTTSLTVGDTTKYTTTVSGGKWKSSNESVLEQGTVDGKTISMKAKSAGTVTLTYTANGITSNKLTITVKEAPKPTPVTPVKPKPSNPTTPTTPVTPVQPAPQIQGSSVIWVGGTATFSVTNGVSGGTWYSSNTAVLSGGGSGTSCTMTGHRAGTAYVYYKANGKESNRIRVQVRGL